MMSLRGLSLKILVVGGGDTGRGDVHTIPPGRGGGHDFRGDMYPGRVREGAAARAEVHLGTDRSYRMGGPYRG